jgi:hypothetical protein
MPSCVLHIGTEKTGSTSLQQCLAANRAALSRAGFIYPQGLGEPSHRKLAVYAMDDDRIDDGRRQYDATSPEAIAALRMEVEEHFSRMRRNFESVGSSSTVIFSSEHCHSRLVRSIEVERLRDLLYRLCDRVQVIVYLRPQHDLAISLYSTALRVGYAGRPVLPSLESPSAYFDYAAMLDRWASCFGRANVTPRIYAREDLSI